MHDDAIRFPAPWSSGICSLGENFTFTVEGFLPHFAAPAVKEAFDCELSAALTKQDCKTDNLHRSLDL